MQTRRVSELAQVLRDLLQTLVLDDVRLIGGLLPGLQQRNSDHSGY